LLASSPLGEVAFRAHALRVSDPRGDRMAARRAARLADATLPRGSAARAIAIWLDAVLFARGQCAVARLGECDRLCGAIVHDPAVDCDPEGEGQHPPLIVGFVGVLIISRPGASTLTYGALFALANAILISSVAIAMEELSQQRHLLQTAPSGC